MVYILLHLLFSHFVGPCAQRCCGVRRGAASWRGARSCGEQFVLTPSWLLVSPLISKRVDLGRTAVSIPHPYFIDTCFHLFMEKRVKRPCLDAARRWRPIKWREIFVNFFGYFYFCAAQVCPSYHGIRIKKSPEEPSNLKLLFFL